MPSPLVPLRARLRRLRLVQPLARRDYALLTAGSVVSLLGDGFFAVALAWQVYEISNVPTALSVVGVAWTLPLDRVTLLQTLVPRDLLWRVSRLDWLVSTGLVPVSFALTGPVAAALGPGETMIGAGLLGAVLMGSLLFVPGVRDPEREAGPAADVLGRLGA